MTCRVRPTPKLEAQLEARSASPSIRSVVGTAPSPRASGSLRTPTTNFTQSFWIASTSTPPLLSKRSICLMPLLALIPFSFAYAAPIAAIDSIAAVSTPTTPLASDCTCRMHLLAEQRVEESLRVLHSQRPASPPLLTTRTQRFRSPLQSLHERRNSSRVA